MKDSNVKLLSVHEISQRYGMSRYTIYTLIKTDSSFPCANIGPKKNYRILPDLFEAWLEQRLKERHYYTSKAPTADQLYKIGRN